MKIKYSRNKLILRTWFVIILLLELDFFGIFQMPSFWYSINSVGHKTLIIAFSLLAALYCSMKMRFKNMKWLYNNSKYLILICLCVFFTAFFSIIKYDSQTFFECYRVFERFFTILIIIPLMYMFVINNDLKWIIKTMEFIAFIYFMVLIVQFILYESSGLVIMKSYFAMNTIGERNGSVRLHLNFLLHFIIIYEFNYLINKDKRLGRLLSHSILLLMGLIVVIFVQKTRSLTLALILSFGICMIFSKKSYNKYIINIFVVLGSIVVIGTTDIATKFISTFIDLSSEYSYSTTVRIAAIKYYFDVIKDNFIFGFGFISDASSDYETILHGPSRSFYLTDVGIVGLMAEMGIMGIIIIIYILKRFIFILRKISLSASNIEYNFLYGFLVFILATLPSIIITDMYRIVALPIVISFFEYIYLISKIKKEVLNNESAN